LDFGKVEFVIEGNGRAAQKLRLTLVGQNDSDVLKRRGLSELRRTRVLRLTREAVEQGCMLSYADLSGLLLCSLATLKRDVCALRKNGHAVQLRRQKRMAEGNA
jgi:hypothetical protein